VKLIALLFERYNLYNKAIVCSFFPTVVYRIKKENPNILTGGYFCLLNPFYFMLKIGNMFRDYLASLVY